MLGETEKTRQVLIERYGISRRLAIRLMALLRRGIHCSPAVLELAAPGSPAERLLLDRELLSRAAGLDEKWLRQKAGECGVYMLQTLGQDRDGLPQELPEILERIARLKASHTIFRRGDKTKIVDALKTLRRRDREFQIKEKLIKSHLLHVD